MRLLKDELEKRKKYPRGVPAGPSAEEQREQRERDAEKARKDAEHALNCKLAWENGYGAPAGGLGATQSRPRLLA
jgi:hypothetical protein